MVVVVEFGAYDDFILRFDRVLTMKSARPCRTERGEGLRLDDAFEYEARNQNLQSVRNRDDRTATTGTLRARIPRGEVRKSIADGLRGGFAATNICVEQCSTSTFNRLRSYLHQWGCSCAPPRRSRKARRKNGGETGALDSSADSHPSADSMHRRGRLLPACLFTSLLFFGPVTCPSDRPVCRDIVLSSYQLFLRLTLPWILSIR